MKKEKLIIYYHLFVPWIHDSYDEAQLLEAWASGESPEDHGLSIAGLLPIQHIKNWDDIKHHFDNEPCDVEGFTKWSEYYEDDGYVHDPCFGSIPDTLKIKWDRTPWEEL